MPGKCPLCNIVTGVCIYYGHIDLLNDEQLMEIIDKIKKYMKNKCQYINIDSDKRYSKGIEVIVEKN